MLIQFRREVPGIDNPWATNTSKQNASVLWRHLFYFSLLSQTRTQSLTALQPTHGAKVQYPCLEGTCKLEHAVYKFCISLYSCLFSLISIGDKSISGPVNMGILSSGLIFCNYGSKKLGLGLSHTLRPLLP